VNHRIRTLAVTGGTGFVGKHLLGMAVAAGYEVRALTRRAQEPQEGIVWVEGALDRPETLSALCAGADAVVHIAGLLTGDRAALEAVNAGGTAAMVDAARRAGVRRFVHVSSLAAREPELSAYGCSKAKSERLVASSGLDWTILRPPAVYGPGDRETMELFKMARRGLVALPPLGRFSVIHVEDLCRLVLAIVPEPRTVAETYEPDDGREGGWAHRDFARALADAYGKRAPLILSMPRWALTLASRAETKLRGANAKLTADRVGYFCHPDWAVAEERRPPPGLWRPQVGTLEGIAQTAAWYRSQGWVK
jgi:nucleoside-diphosphate-sugar epimerase